MNINEVELRLREIQSKTHDDESAHALQDHLYSDLLTYISASLTTDNAEEIRDMAAMAIKSEGFDFCRYYS